MSADPGESETWPTASCCGEPRVSPEVNACYDHAKLCPRCDLQPMEPDAEACPWCLQTVGARRASFPEADVREIERVHMRVADRLRAARGSVYKAFESTGTGLNPEALEVWWQESPAAQSMGDQSGKAFGGALSVAMMAVEADRALRRGGTEGGVSMSTERPDQSGVSLIAAERERQVAEEPWTPEHDDRHVSQELAYAAASYVVPEAVLVGTVGDEIRLRDPWPWEGRPKRDENLRAPYAGPMSRWLTNRGERATRYRQARIRELVKAGALIAAEIDRLQRQEARNG